MEKSCPEGPKVTCSRSSNRLLPVGSITSRCSGNEPALFPRQTAGRVSLPFETLRSRSSHFATNGNPRFHVIRLHILRNIN